MAHADLRFKAAARKLPAQLALWATLVFVQATGMAAAAAENLSIVAQVDKTTTKLGEPINLTIRFSGNLSEIHFAPVTLPQGLLVVARSQSTNITVHEGALERSLAMTYVLLPQHTGTFQLGPFPVVRGQQTLKTDPITITVLKSTLPPESAPHERFTL